MIRINFKKITIALIACLFTFSITQSVFADNKKNRRRNNIGKLQKMFFKANDTNKDGKVSKEEWFSRFDTIDQNKDGSIDKKEFRQHLRKKQQEHKKKKRQNRNKKKDKNKKTNKNKEKNKEKEKSESPDADEGGEG